MLHVVVIVIVVVVNGINFLMKGVYIMNNLFVNFQTEDVIDINIQKEYDIKHYIENKNIVMNFLENKFFYINHKKKKYILKTYQLYKQKYNLFKFLKNREDIDLYITEEDFKENFVEYKNKEVTDADIYHYILTVLEGKQMPVFKFQVDKKPDGTVFFEYPLALDNKLEDFFTDRPNVVFIDSPNVYNVICGLLKDNHRVYTTVDKLTFLSVDDLVIVKSDENNIINISEDEYVFVRQLELDMKDMFNRYFIIDMEKYYFQFNLLLNYFLSKNIHINMFQKTIEDIYESVIETIDKLDDIEIEEDLLDKLEELLLLKNKIDLSIRIENMYNTLKKELLDKNISKEEKEQKLENGKLELKTLFELNKQQLDKR